MIVDWLQEAGANKAFGVVLNPGGLTHTSVAVHDAIKGIKRAGDRNPHQQHPRARAVA